MQTSKKWSGIKKAVLADPNVKNNPELADTLKKLFKMYNQGLTKKAVKVNKLYDEVSKAQIPSLRKLNQLNTGLAEVMAIADAYIKSTNMVEKGFLKKHPYKGGTFKFLKAQLEAIKKELVAIETVINA